MVLLMQVQHDSVFDRDMDPVDWCDHVDRSGVASIEGFGTPTFAQATLNWMENSPS